MAAETEKAGFPAAAIEELEVMQAPRSWKIFVEDPGKMNAGEPRLRLAEFQL